MSSQFEKISAIPRSLNVFVAVLAALVLFLAGTMVSYQPAGASETLKKDARPAFYLTPLTYTGSQALNACAAGFHMASMSEVLDPSNLRYDTVLGLTAADSGSGVPIGSGGEFGWLRTGRSPLGGVGGGVADFGKVNCNAWTSNSNQDSGSAVTFVVGWKPPVNGIGPWEADALTCDTPTRVWCVQD